MSVRSSSIVSPCCRNFNVSAINGFSTPGAGAVCTAVGNVFNKLLGNRRSSRGSAGPSMDGLQGEETLLQKPYPGEGLSCLPQLTLRDTLTELELKFEPPVGTVNSTAVHSNAMGCLSTLRSLRILNLTKEKSGGCIQMSTCIKM
jgi:hypothetical protein